MHVQNERRLSPGCGSQLRLGSSNPATSSQPSSPMIDSAQTCCACASSMLQVDVGRLRSMIIGKEGVNINRLRQNTSVDVHVGDLELTLKGVL